MPKNYLSEPACMHENLVFHFTNTDAALNIVESLEFKAGKLHKTNDMREILLYEQLSDPKMKNMLEKHCHTFSFSSNFQRTNSSIRYYGYFKPRMWAQYANNSNGICFIIEKNSFIKCICDFFGCQNVFQDVIKYQEILPDFTNQNLDNEKVGIYSKELFFVKHLDWRDEDEYRVLVISEEDQIKVKIPCNDDSFIKGLIMGTKFPYKAELIYRLRKTGLMNFVSLYNSTAKYDGVSVAHWTENEMNLF